MIYWILLFWLLISQGQNISNLNRATILYFNDAHEISPVQDHLGSRGGVARIKTIVDKVRMQNAQTIVVFGGDLAGGTLFGAVYKGFPLVEAFISSKSDASGSEQVNLTEMSSSKSWLVPLFIT